MLFPALRERPIGGQGGDGVSRAMLPPGFIWQCLKTVLVCHNWGEAL